MSDSKAAEDDIPEAWRPIRDAMRNVLRRSMSSCGDGDRKRAADRIGRLHGNKIAIGDDPTSLGAWFDMSLFEPNDRGKRPFDRFLAGAARSLPANEQDIASRMGSATFSIFRVTGSHDEIGCWVEDLLDSDRRLWVFDLRLNDNAGIGQTIGMRVYDAGPFHAMTGPAMPISEKFIETCRNGLARNGELPFRRSLAATVYGMSYLPEGRPTHVSGMKFARDLFAAIESTRDRPAAGGEAASA